MLEISLGLMMMTGAILALMGVYEVIEILYWKYVDWKYKE